jgi:hypothetical protein
MKGIKDSTGELAVVAVCALRCSPSAVCSLYGPLFLFTVELNENALRGGESQDIIQIRLG